MSLQELFNLNKYKECSTSFKNIITEIDKKIKNSKHNEFTEIKYNDFTAKIEYNTKNKSFILNFVTLKYFLTLIFNFRILTDKIEKYNEDYFEYSINGYKIQIFTCFDSEIQYYSMNREFYDRLFLIDKELRFTNIEDFPDLGEYGKIFNYFNDYINNNDKKILKQQKEISKLKKEIDALKSLPGSKLYEESMKEFYSLSK